MPRAIKATDGLIHVCLCLALMLVLIASVGAQQPVKIEAEGEGVWRLTTTLMGQAESIDWAPEMSERPEIEWQNNRGFVDIQWVVRSDERPGLGTAVFMRSVDGQTERVELTVDPSVDVIGPVGAGMTLWGIGSDWLATWNEGETKRVSDEADRSPPTMPEWLDQIMQANPQAFETDEPNSLMRGAMLRHPIQRRVADVVSAEAMAAERSASERSVSMDSSIPEPNPAWSGEQAPLTEDFPTQTPAPATEENIVEVSIPAEDPIEEVLHESSWFSFDFIAQTQWWHEPHQLGRVALAVGLVVIAVLILQIFSKVGGGGRWDNESRPAGAHAKQPVSTMTPEAVEMTLGLAQRYVDLGDATQALHWLDEVMAHGSPKQIRQAKRVKRDALAAISHVHD